MEVTSKEGWNAMLVIARKVGQEIRIGEEIVLTVVEIKGNGVRLGIKAPREMPVTRPDRPEKPTHESAHPNRP